jgi:hypothetical protein
LLFLSRDGQPTTNSATREAEELGLVAAAKKEQAEEHGERLAPEAPGEESRFTTPVPEN